jgi:hypothetical protein
MQSVGRHFCWWYIVNTWINTEVAIGQTQVSLCIKMIDENVDKEKAKSEVDENDYHLFCVSIYNRWNYRLIWHIT